ncbi:precorrin-3B C(17)-methyltransferase [Tessaracoccus massiliensis]|uniref:precorrin-3B C(17)-methyltransferase n=1 Tax=Tessaracoccus massiliensis TaxID=1522311 RepID=UPI000694053C|nr:precorrin-3B C(17)-methyltransferase [Tessaracoccus massiliensis]
MITLFGLLGLPSPELRAAVATADLVVASARHLAVLDAPEERTFHLRGVSAAVDAIRSQPADDTVVVVASGDPLFYGIGARLRREGFTFTTVTAPSSVAAAFAAVSLPWDDAKVVTAHGRDPGVALAAVRRHPKVAVLTSGAASAADLARELEGLDRWVVIAEKLGEPEERVRVVPLAEAATLDDIAEPHVAIFLSAHPDEVAQDGPPAEAGEPVVGQITNSKAARRHADAIDRALGIRSRRYDGVASEGLPRAWGECDLIVSHLATGATIRLIAGLLQDKAHDPGVVVVDEAGRFAVPIVGGHAGGANDLARRIGDALGATPVLTTATDALNLPALDTLGWPYHGDVAAVTQAIIDEAPVALIKERPWPLPALPGNVTAEAENPVARIVVSQRAAEAVIAESSVPTVVLNPPSLVVGMGCNSGTSREHLEALLHETLDGAGLAHDSVTAVVTHDVKAGELGLVQLVAKLGVPLTTYPPEELASFEVPTPSRTVESHVGTPSVSEAAVMARGAQLIVPKQRSTDATCAVGELPARGKLSVVGIGPGARDLLTPRAVRAVREATFLIGYGPYVRQVRDLARPGCDIAAKKMGTEEARTAEAIERARGGENVVLVCSGDPSIYAMASPTLEQGTMGIDVEMVPGITASLAASSILGAALGHDHATISLSDLHTQWEAIEQRLQAAAEGDFVVALYNPRSKKRRAHLPRALEILGAHRPPSTPVAVVRQAERPQQKATLSTLAEFSPEMVDMNSIVIVGSSRSRYVASGGGELRFITPRDYAWLGDGTGGDGRGPEGTITEETL